MHKNFTIHQWMILKVDFALKQKTFYMSKMNSNKFLHNTTFSVQLPYRSLPLNWLDFKVKI